jgi:hypothetical protein
VKRTILGVLAFAFLTAACSDKPADAATADAKPADAKPADAPAADPAKIEAADIKPEQADAVASALEKEIADDLASEGP